MVKSKSIKIHKNQTEHIRKQLIELSLLNRKLKIIKNSKYAYLPIIKISDKTKQFLIVTKDFEQQKIKPDSYKDIIDIPDEQKDLLPTSFDIIGDIVLIKIPEELIEHKQKIGNALLDFNKNIITVAQINPVEGEYRTRTVEIIAGENKTITIHKEYGAEFKIDVNNVYFSPRLANERIRIAGLVQTNETIIDMFTGVAPFPIIISKHAKPKKILAIDKNKQAIELARENIIKNKVDTKIKLLCEDSEKIKDISKENNIKPDRIIMNLPFSSIDFFEYALEIIEKKCTIHIYIILKEDEIDDKINVLRNVAREKEIILENIKINKIKTYAPHEFYIGIDITAKKK